MTAISSTTEIETAEKQSHLAKQVVQEIMAARNSIPVFEEDMFHAGMDANAFCEKNCDVNQSKSRTRN